MTGLSKWPWSGQLRLGVCESSGAIDEVVALGLVNDREQLERVSRLLAVCLPDEEPCVARWLLEGRNTACVEITSRLGVYRQSFVRQDDGWVVKQDLMGVDSVHRAKGLAKRLIRNLVVLYDELGIYHASTFADHEVGGYSWARFGARACDPVGQRGQLAERLAELVSDGTIGDEYERPVLQVIHSAADDELMLRVAALATEDGVPIGRPLLLSHAWEAYWDLRDADLRTYLRRVLG